MTGRGHDDVDLLILFMEIARSSGIEPRPEGVAVSAGLES